MKTWGKRTNRLCSEGGGCWADSAGAEQVGGTGTLKQPLLGDPGTQEVAFSLGKGLVSLGSCPRCQMSRGVCTSYSGWGRRGPCGETQPAGHRKGRRDAGRRRTGACRACSDQRADTEPARQSCGPQQRQTGGNQQGACGQGQSPCPEARAPVPREHLGLWPQAAGRLLGGRALCSDGSSGNPRRPLWAWDHLEGVGASAQRCRSSPPCICGPGRSGGQQEALKVRAGTT